MVNVATFASVVQAVVEADQTVNANATELFMGSAINSTDPKEATP